MSGYRNIAILGSDARADEGYDGSRTDAIIIMSIKTVSYTHLDVYKRQAFAGRKSIRTFINLFHKL